MPAPSLAVQPRGKAEPPHRMRRAARVAGWALVVLGGGHLLTVAATAVGDQDAATRRALDGLSAVRVGLPGPRPTLADLFTGYSLMMGLMVVTAGALLLTLSRRGGQDAGALRTALWLTAASSALGLVVSWRMLPFPPLIGLSVALLASVAGLIRGRDGLDGLDGPGRPANGSV